MARGHGGEPLPRQQAGVQLDGAEAPLQVSERLAGRTQSQSRGSKRGVRADAGMPATCLGRACRLLVLREPVEEWVLGRVPAGHSRIPEREDS